MRRVLDAIAVLGVASLLFACRGGSEARSPVDSETSSSAEAPSAESATEPALSDAASEPPSEPYPLGPEMAQLERDLASDEYRKTILAWRNHNDLNGEMNRLDLPDSAARFVAAEGGLEAVREDPAKRAAWERRKEIETDFLELMEEAYRGLDKAEVFVAERERIRLESAQDQVARATEAPSEVVIESVLPAPGAERFWPRWRGPTGQGTSEEADVPLEWSATENIAWKTPLPGRGHSSPVIWGERIYLTTAFEDTGASGRARRSLLGIDRASGEILFTSDAPREPLEAKSIDKNSWASPTVVTDGERVIAFLGSGGLVAFSLDGEFLWHYPMPWFDGSHGTGASPAIVGELAVIVQEHSRGASYAVAVDRRTGEERWKLELDTALGWCTVTPLRVARRETVSREEAARGEAGRTELVVGLHHRLVALDPANGAELWSFTGPTREVVPTVVHGHGLLYSCSGRNGPTLAVRPGGNGDVTETHLVWKATRGAPHVPSPILVGERLYFTNDNGIVSCLDALSGTTVYQERLRGKFTASPVAAAGRIYFTNEVGRTFVVRTGDAFEILAENDIEEGVLASAAILDGRIYLRSFGHLWAIGR